MKICYITVLDRVIKYFVKPHVNSVCEENEVTCISNFTDEKFREELEQEAKTVDIKISRNVNPINLIKSIIKLTKFFKKEKFDIIQYTGPSTSLICSIAGKRAKIKKRVYCLWGVRYEGFNGIKRSIFKFLEKKTCKLSTNVIFDSESNRDFLIGEGVVDSNKTRVISKGSACGIDTNVFDINKKEEYKKTVRDKYQIPSEAFVFGYLGRVSQEKGINEFLYAIKQITQEDENVYALIVGFIENEVGLDKQLLEWARNEKRVIFTGRQDNPEMFYASFNMFVFPSYREGFGGGVVQAGALAVPSIVSDIGPLKESIRYGELGRYCRLKDSDSLLEEMRNLYKDKNTLEKLGQDMLNYVQQNFDMKLWTQEYKQYLLDME
ncbi:MAG: glycosyltransferase [Clostridia bacterium]|nr:glycosyltransferase [Clostridia bacterium]